MFVRKDLACPSIHPYLLNSAIAHESNIEGIEKAILLNLKFSINDFLGR